MDNGPHSNPLIEGGGIVLLSIRECCIDIYFFIKIFLLENEKASSGNDNRKRLVKASSLIFPSSDSSSGAGWSTSIPIKSEPVAKASAGLCPQPFSIRGVCQIVYVALLNSNLVLK